VWTTYSGSCHLLSNNNEDAKVEKYRKLKVIGFSIGLGTVKLFQWHANYVHGLVYTILYYMTCLFTLHNLYPIYSS